MIRSKLGNAILGIFGITLFLCGLWNTILMLTENHLRFDAYATILFGFLIGLGLWCLAGAILNYRKLKSLDMLHVRIESHSFPEKIAAVLVGVTIFGILGMILIITLLLPSGELSAVARMLRVVFILCIFSGIIGAVVLPFFCAKSKNADSCYNNRS